MQTAIVDTVYRKFKMTARAMEQQFGRDALPPVVLKDVENSPYTEHTILHAVYPRAGKPGRAAKNKAIASDVLPHGQQGVVVGERL
jgi:hypothetical protein